MYITGGELMKNKKIIGIGELAKLTGITIRTLQYYDEIGILPSNKNLTSGKRYYSEKDLLKLQQIMFYKSMGMNLSKIKNILQEANDNLEIKKVLTKQKAILSKNLNNIKSSIAFLEIGLEILEVEGDLALEQIVQLLVGVNVNTIFEYSEIDFNNEDMEALINDSVEDVDIIELYWDWKKLILEASCKVITGVNPSSKEGQVFAKKWINMVNKITKQDIKLLNAHKASYENREIWPEEDRRLMDFADNFIDEAVNIYLG